MAKEGSDPAGVASGLLGCAVLLVPIFLIGECVVGGSSQPTDVPAPVPTVSASPSPAAAITPPLSRAPPKRRTHPVKIEPIAVDPYTRSDYPDVYRRYGRLVPTINKERRRAAHSAALDGRCDGVENVQITDYGSIKDRHYMVECSNLTRLYFNRAGLTSGKATLSETEPVMRSGGLVAY